MMFRLPVIACIAAVVAAVSAAPCTAAPPAAPSDAADAAFSVRADRFLASARTEPVRRFKIAPDGAITFVTPDPGKYLWNQIFALLAADSSGNQFLPGTTPAVTVRRMIHALFTYPDLFHFNADGPAACLTKYPGLVTPEDRRYFFEGHSRSLLARTEALNYDLFTGEGTENHLAMSRYAAYLLCQNWLSDHPADSRAQTGLGQARMYILFRAATVPRRGTGEWNSSTYYGYALRGLLLCEEGARDRQIQTACRKLLDAYAGEMALGYLDGVDMRPESRGMRHDSLDAERDQISYLWWGSRRIDTPKGSSGASNVVWAARARYRPPASLAVLADKSTVGPQGRAYFNCHPSYLLNRASESRESVFVGPGGQYAVSCAYLPYAGYTGATQQFIPAKIVGRGNTGKSTWTVLGNDNSRSDTGIGRGPYTQWAQSGSTLVQMTAVPVDAAERAAQANAVTADWQTAWKASFRRRWRNKGDEASTHGPTAAEVRIEGITSYLLLPEDALVVPDTHATNRLFV